MDGATLTRWRWRLRGAWMWRSLVVLSLVDGAMVHSLPIFGDYESAVSGWLLGLVCSLLAIIILAPSLGWLLRRVRQDMPRVVARDYAGAGVCAAVTLALMSGGLFHHALVTRDQRAVSNAVNTAESYIGEHAPVAFMRSMDSAGAINVYALQPPQIYRVCDRAWIRQRGAPVPTARYYCVVANLAKSFARSARYGGSEPNGLLSEGTS